MTLINIIKNVTTATRINALKPIVNNGQASEKPKSNQSYFLQSFSACLPKRSLDISLSAIPSMMDLLR